jgi:hypothetical protein
MTDSLQGTVLQTPDGCFVLDKTEKIKEKGDKNLAPRRREGFVPEG